MHMTLGHPDEQQPAALRRLSAGTIGQMASPKQIAAPLGICSHR